jgi:zinc transport system permease protein
MNPLVAWLEPTFMQRAALGLALLAPACAAMGTQVVQARMAFFSDAIAHSAFTGVAIGLVLGISPVATMVAFALAVAVAVILFKSTGRLPTDTVIGVFLSAAVALGLALVSLTRQTVSFTKYLFGDVLAITNGELAAAAALAVAAFAFLLLFGNRLALAGLSPSLARTRGVAVVWLETLFALLLAALVAVSVRFVGALLVTALLLVPAAAARQAARSVSGNFWLAVVIGLAASMVGLFASFQFDVSTGASVILAAVFLFAACAVIGRVRRGR